MARKVNAFLNSRLATFGGRCCDGDNRQRMETATDGVGTTALRFGRCRCLSLR